MWLLVHTIIWSIRLFRSSSHHFSTQVTKEIDEDRIVDVGISKTFDRVPLYKLVQKLKAHDVQGDLVYWIQNYFSHWMSLSSGVPEWFV